MKKIASFILVLSLTFCLTSCSGLTDSFFSNRGSVESEINQTDLTKEEQRAVNFVQKIPVSAYDRENYFEDSFIQAIMGVFVIRKGYSLSEKPNLELDKSYFDLDMNDYFGFQTSDKDISGKYDNLIRIELTSDNKYRLIKSTVPELKKTVTSIEKIEDGYKVYCTTKCYGAKYKGGEKGPNVCVVIKENKSSAFGYYLDYMEKVN